MSKKNVPKLSKNVIAIIIVILVIMVVSISFRLMVYKNVKVLWGEDYIDSDTGVPFLTEMDSYYHLRMTKDILKYGHPGEAVKDGKSRDTLNYAPHGTSVQNYKSLLSYITIITYKIISIFRDTSVDRVAYWLGTFLSALVVIPVFVLTNKLKGKAAAIVASVLASINYGYFTHTVPGFYDTDMVISWTSCFFLCFLTLFMLSLTEGEGKKKKISYGVICFISMMIFMNSWDAYMLFVGIALLSLIIYQLLPYLFKKKKAFIVDSKHWLYVSGIIFVIVITIVLFDFEVIRTTLRLVSKVFVGGSESVMPDAFVSISELRKPSLVAGGFEGLFQMKVLSDTNIGIINYVGGIVPVLTALAMVVLISVKNIKEKLRFEYVLMTVWFLVTLILAFRALRFIMLFALPVAILSGIFVGEICELMSKKKMMDWKVYAVMLSLLAIFPALYGAYRSTADSGPLINKSFAKTVNEIKNNTSENTIVTSWWDYGYFYQYKAERRTLFDGGTQNGIRIYWVSRALATDDENFSANIINMLAGEGDKATEEMFNTFGESKDTLSFMNEILSTDKEEAIQKLESAGADSERADELFRLMFPDEIDPVICLITNDMPRVADWFYVFGYNEGDYNSYSEEYSVFVDRVDYDLADGLKAWKTNANGQMITFAIEKTEEGYTAYIAPENDEVKVDYEVEKVIEVCSDHVTEYTLSDLDSEKKIGLTAVVTNVDETCRVSLMTSSLSNSVFGRLFYTGGVGLDRYTPAEFQGGSGSLFYIDSH